MAEESYRNPLFGRRVDRYIPPEIRQGIGALVAGADMLNPVSAYRDYISAAKRGETGEAAANLAGFVAPGVAGALASRLARPAVSAASQYSDDAARALMEMLSPTGAPEFREAPAVRETPPVSAGQGDIPPPPEVTPPMRRTLEDMRASARARIQEKNALVEQLTANEAPVRMSDGVLTALVSRSPDREGWRVTYFQPDGSPSGHSDAADKASAVRKALDDQFRPIKAPASTRGEIPPPPEVTPPMPEATPDLGRGLGSFEFPSPEISQRTQISGTFPTYKRALEVFDEVAPEGRALDYGAGLGKSSELGFDTFEPYAREGFEPTYRSASDIPDASYDRVTNLNVLNVVDPASRGEIVRDIGRILKPEGVAIITTRGRDVLNAKGRPGPEDMSIVTSAGTYQKGFTRAELVDYLRGTLGENFEVSPLQLGPAGAMVRKKR